MCRNIKTLYNYRPEVTPEEIRASALQYVRKITGMNVPSEINTPVFDRAVDELTVITSKLIKNLKTHAPARSREADVQRATERSKARFGR